MKKQTPIFAHNVDGNPFKTVVFDFYAISIKREVLCTSQVA